MSNEEDRIALQKKFAITIYLKEEGRNGEKQYL
jgi:hypothetical protein